MIKSITFICLTAFLFSCFNQEVKASEILDEKRYLKDVVTYSADENKSTLDLEFIKEDVDFYYVNICDKTNDIPGCKNEKYYTEAFQRKEKKVTLAFHKEGIQGIEIAMKTKEGTNKGIAFLIIDVSRKNFLENSFVAPKDDKFIQTLLKTEFRGYEKWNPHTRVMKVHRYITKNYKYDYDLYNEIVQGTINFNNPDLKKMKDKKIGICYDLASLNGAILRAMGVPTKLEVGKAITSSNSSVSHAWNSVYINKRWKLIDTTWDLGKSFTYKNPSKYKVSYVY